MNIEPGRYIAKPIGGTWEQVGDNMTPAVKIKFAIIPARQEITHTLWLSEKAHERTFDTLINVLEYNENKDLLHEASGPYFDHTFFPEGKEVELVIENRDRKGKLYPEVKWVNVIGGSRMSAGMPIQQVIGGINIKAAAAAARARAGIKKPDPVPTTPETTPF